MALFCDVVRLEAACQSRYIAGFAARRAAPAYSEGGHLSGGRLASALSPSPKASDPENAMKKTALPKSQKTYMAKPGELEPQWVLVDATDKVVGRLASEIAVRLMGKHRPTYTPHVDTGDYVVVINAEKVRFTGNKWEQKRYTWYTGYPRQRSETAAKRLERHPERILSEAVRRMLPKNKLGRRMLAKLKIYAGEVHPHQAQRPEPVDLGAKKTAAT